MKSIIIDPEFRALIPAPTQEELEMLEDNLKQDGCRDPLVLWDGILIDGHNRFEICTRLGIDFKTVQQPLEDRAHATEWIIRNQFGRRNLVAFVRVKLALRLEDVIRARAKANFGQRTDLPQISAKGLVPVETREELAKLAGVSRATVSQVKQIEAHAAPEVQAKVEAGEITINSAFKTIEKTAPALIAAPVPESPTPAPRKLPISEARQLWNIAQNRLDNINKNAPDREQILGEVIAYAQKRLASKK